MNEIVALKPPKDIPPPFPKNIFGLQKRPEIPNGILIGKPLIHSPNVKVSLRSGPFFPVIIHDKQSFHYSIP